MIRGMVSQYDKNELTAEKIDLVNMERQNALLYIYTYNIDLVQSCQSSTLQLQLTPRVRTSETLKKWEDPQKSHNPRS